MKISKTLAAIANALLGPPEERAARRVENELRDELEATIAHLRCSNAHAMMFAGLAIQHGKRRAAQQGIPLRKATIDLLDDLTVATGSLPRALALLGQMHYSGWDFSPYPVLASGDKILVLDDVQHQWTVVARVQSAASAVQ